MEGHAEAAARALRLLRGIEVALHAVRERVRGVDRVARDRAKLLRRRAAILDRDLVALLEDPRGAPHRIAREVPHHVHAVGPEDHEVLASRAGVLLAAGAHLEEVANQSVLETFLRVNDRGLRPNLVS